MNIWKRKHTQKHSSIELSATFLGDAICAHKFVVTYIGAHAHTHTHRHKYIVYTR